MHVIGHCHINIIYASFPIETTITFYTCFRLVSVTLIYFVCTFLFLTWFAAVVVVVDVAFLFFSLFSISRGGCIQFGYAAVIVKLSESTLIYLLYVLCIGIRNKYYYFPFDCNFCAVKKYAFGKWASVDSIVTILFNVYSFTMK